MLQAFEYCLKTPQLNGKGAIVKPLSTLKRLPTVLFQFYVEIDKLFNYFPLFVSGKWLLQDNAKLGGSW